MQQSYSLKALCQASDVTERTIRFYIKEGLLPPPSGTGSSSRYGYEHLLRLQFILRLKAEFLPLGEIKNLLAGKTLEELSQLAKQTDWAAKESNSLEEVLQPDVSQSLRRQLKGGSTEVSGQPKNKSGSPYSPIARSYAPPPAPMMASPFLPTASLAVPSGPPLPPRDRLRSSASPMPFFQGQAEPIGRLNADEKLGEDWERITIAAGVELHVQKEIVLNQRLALEKLIEAAQKLLK